MTTNTERLTARAADIVGEEVRKAFRVTIGDDTFCGACSTCSTAIRAATTAANAHGYRVDTAGELADDFRPVAYEAARAVYASTVRAVAS